MAGRQGHVSKQEGHSGLEGTLPPSSPPHLNTFLVGRRFIGLGFTTCALVGGNLSPELRKAQPGLFAALYS